MTFLYSLTLVLEEFELVPPISPELLADRRKFAATRDFAPFWTFCTPLLLSLLSWFSFRSSPWLMRLLISSF